MKHPPPCTPTKDDVLFKTTSNSSGEKVTAVESTLSVPLYAVPDKLKQKVG